MEEFVFDLILGSGFFIVGFPFLTARAGRDPF
jgi:hypothetical protein